jgi:hypothetical protein
MELDYAIDRLYETGWSAGADEELETLTDGRRYPSVSAVKKEFSRAGLTIQIAHASKFSCYRATWSPAAGSSGDRHGTVIGASEHEAAVFALAQLMSARVAGPLVGA